MFLKLYEVILPKHIVTTIIIEDLFPGRYVDMFCSFRREWALNV